jgi:Spy/CpxP family protein refolding chaperone
MNKRLMWIGSAFTAGLLLGIGLMALIQSDGPGDLDVETLDGALSPAGNSPNASLLARIREQEAELARLRTAAAARLLEATDVPVETEPESEPEPPRRAGFLNRMEERMSQRVNELVSAYGLSDEQRARLEDVYRQRFENFQARRQGEDVEPFNLDAAIEDILTDEQFAQYLEDSQEEIYNRAELMATSQLVRLRQAVEVQPEQEALVYDAIHYTAQEMMIARQTGEDFDMRAVMSERLGSILTEEQMAAFRESLRGGPGRGPGFGP